jgi:hypothetical protein
MALRLSWLVGLSFFILLALYLQTRQLQRFVFDKAKNQNRFKNHSILKLQNPQTNISTD